jgi:2-dehydropantoate 2-reductase
LIAVLGPGAVGGLLAAALARSGEAVTVVARGQTAATIAERGLSVRSERLGDFHVPVAAVAQVRDPDTLLVATKADTLADALERVEGAPQLVVPLLNGLEHMTVLRARFGPERVVAGSIRVQAERVAAGEIVHASDFLRVEVSEDAAGEALVATLRRAGVDAAVGGSEAQVLWSKFVRLCAVACTTAAYDLPLGAIRERAESRAQLHACVREVAAVARAEGADGDAQATLRELAELGANSSSSLRRDVAAGRAGELDAIAGAVVRAGQRHGLECETVASLGRMIARRLAP